MFSEDFIPRVVKARHCAIKGLIDILLQNHEGLINHIGGNPDSSVELVPVDMVVNSLISMSWYLGTGRHGQGDKLDPLVVHVHSSTDNIIVLKDVCKFSRLLVTMCVIFHSCLSPCV